MSLDAIGIVSSDLQKTVKFYELLGISLVPVGGDEHLEGSTTSGVRIMVDSIELMKKVNPKFTISQGVGIVLCFKQKTSENVDALCSSLISSGAEVVKKPWDAFWGQRYCSILDPDGNQIDLFADL